MGERQLSGRLGWIILMSLVASSVACGGKGEEGRSDVAQSDSVADIVDSNCIDSCADGRDVALDGAEDLEADGTSSDLSGDVSQPAIAALFPNADGLLDEEVTVRSSEGVTLVIPAGTQMVDLQ